MLFLNVTAGILVISNAVPIVRELTGATPAAAAALYGTLAVANGLGRFLWGAVSDRTGRPLAYALVFGTQAAAFLALGRLSGTAPVAAALVVVLLGYGGGFGTMPAFVADLFGTRHLGAIFGWILLAWSAGGLVGPLFVAAVKDATGAYAGALPAVAVALAVAAGILPRFARRPGG
jgi:MFS family permease